MLPGPSAQPYPGQPPYPYQGQPPYPFPGQPPQAGANVLAIVSFILGLLGFILPFAVVSAVLGIVALVQIRGRQQRGKGLAITGLVVAGLWLALYLGLIVTAIATSSSTSTGFVPPGGGTALW